MKTSRAMASRHLEPVALSEDYGADSRTRTSPLRNTSASSRAAAAGGPTLVRRTRDPPGHAPADPNQPASGDRPPALVDGSANAALSACAVDPKKRRRAPRDARASASASVSAPTRSSATMLARRLQGTTQQKRRSAGPVAPQYIGTTSA